jgi:hypothetical protein
LSNHEDPETVAHIVAESIRGILDYPGAFADGLAHHAGRFGLRNGDGLGLLRWLVELGGDADGQRWMEQARADVEQVAAGSEMARDGR